MKYEGYRLGYEVYATRVKRYKEIKYIENLRKLRIVGVHWDSWYEIPHLSISSSIGHGGYRYYNYNENNIFLKRQKCSYSYANEKMCCTFVNIMRRFFFKRCFKGWFSTRVKIFKIRDLMRIVLAIAESGINGTICNWNSRKEIV